MSDRRPHWRRDFYAGLAVALPVAISLAIFKWLVGTASSFAATLLFFLPWVIDREHIFLNGLNGPIFWYWNVVALLLAAALLLTLGRVARVYIGRRIIGAVDALLLRVPILNRIHSVVKQVNEAFTSKSGQSFRQCVLVEFPRAGVYSLGFVTGTAQAEVQARTQAKVLTVFVPTTPNPTTGFLIMVPEDGLTYLDMSVPDGLKFIISLGSVSPEWQPGGLPLPSGNSAPAGQPAPRAV
ncbi:MAG: DUF502 domain-containing protein [Limisphaerales bacterium]